MINRMDTTQCAK